MPHVIEGRQSLTALYAFSHEPARTDFAGTSKIDFKGSIELQSVCFGYGSETLIQDVSLVLEPGSITTVVGPNGGGKTTLARLILGLYKPKRGQFLPTAFRTRIWTCSI